MNNRMTLELPSLSANGPFARDTVAAFCAQLDPSLDELSDVKASMDLLNYDEMLVQAIFAGSDDEVTSIVESFRAQLKSAGIDKLYDYVEAVYAEDPETVQVIVVE